MVYKIKKKKLKDNLKPKQKRLTENKNNRKKKTVTRN
jgi:hypothetical protein